MKLANSAFLSLPADGCALVMAEELADDRCQAIGKAGAADDDEVEQVVHEAGGAEFFRAVVPDHDGIGKAEDDHADLPDDDRDAQRDQFAVMVGVACRLAHGWSGFASQAGVFMSLPDMGSLAS